MTDSAEPALPWETYDADADMDTVKPGLTKREYFAGMAMQGLLAGDPTRAEVAVSAQAVRHADALLAELERGR